MDNEACRLFEAQESEAWARVVSTNYRQPRGVSSETLFKIKQIDNAAVNKDMDATMQLNIHGKNTPLLRNLVTNDGMLRYKIIESCFFTDTFFVTKE